MECPFFVQEPLFQEADARQVALLGERLRFEAGESGEVRREDLRRERRCCSANGRTVLSVKGSVESFGSKIDNIPRF